MQLVGLLLGALILCFLPGGSALLHAQEVPVYQGEEIMVTAERFEMLPKNAPREIFVLPRAAIEVLPVVSISELLGFVPGFDLRERGFAGIQADPSIRGSGFEQTLLLVDGIRVFDPQTGHHLLNLPLDFEFVDRIEVLKGPGSAFGGPGAFGGTIHIITRHPDEGIRIEFEKGHFGRYEGRLRFAGRAGNWHHAAVFSRDISGGYRENTDFARNRFLFRTKTVWGTWHFEAQAGWLDKKFGANSFYSARFPYQWEHVTTSLATVRLYREYGGGIIQIGGAHRQNDDTFVLDKNRPAWYQNRHRTRTEVVGMQWNGNNRIGRFWLYGDVATALIRSSNLGYYRRHEAVMALGQQLSSSRFQISLSGSAYWMKGQKFHFSPGISVLYRMAHRVRMFGSVQHGFRMPSFTELYYRSPANVGNPYLRPEINWTYEAGLRLNDGTWKVEAAAFQRLERNLIDWVRENDIWHARNYRNMQVTGCELSSLYPFRIGEFQGKVFLAYAWLRFRRNNASGVSKYAFRHLPHHFVAQFNWQVGRVGGFVGWRVWQRYGQSWKNVVDASVYCRVGRITLRAEARNLADQAYENFPGVPAPGRWIRFSLIWDRSAKDR